MLLLNLSSKPCGKWGKKKKKTNTKAMVLGCSDNIQCCEEENLEPATTNCHSTGINESFHQMLQTFRSFPYLPPIPLRWWRRGGTSMWWSGCFVSRRYTLLLRTHLCSKLVVMVLCSYHSCTKKQGILFCILLFHSLRRDEKEFKLSWTAP